MEENQSDELVINSVNFNQDSGCFICCTNHGLQVYNTYKLQSTFERGFIGGLKFAEMLYRTNIIAFIGTGNNTNYP
jgi:hypothetical protein